MFYRWRELLMFALIYMARIASGNENSKLSTTAVDATEGLQARSSTFQENTSTLTEKTIAQGNKLSSTTIETIPSSQPFKNEPPKTQTTFQKTTFASTETTTAQGNELSSTTTKTISDSQTLEKKPTELQAMLDQETSFASTWTMTVQGDELNFTTTETISNSQPLKNGPTQPQTKFQETSFASTETTTVQDGENNTDSATVRNDTTSSEKIDRSTGTIYDVMKTFFSKFLLIVGSTEQEVDEKISTQSSVSTVSPTPNNSTPDKITETNSTAQGDKLSSTITKSISNSQSLENETIEPQTLLSFTSTETMAVQDGENVTDSATVRYHTTSSEKIKRNTDTISDVMNNTSSDSHLQSEQSTNNTESTETRITGTTSVELNDSLENSTLSNTSTSTNESSEFLTPKTNTSFTTTLPDNSTSLSSGKSNETLNPTTKDLKTTKDNPSTIPGTAITTTPELTTTESTETTTASEDTTESTTADTTTDPTTTDITTDSTTTDVTSEPTTEPTEATTHTTDDSSTSETPTETTTLETTSEITTTNLTTTTNSPTTTNSTTVSTTVESTTPLPPPNSQVVEIVSGILGVLLLAGLIATAAVMYRHGKLPWNPKNSNASVRPLPILLSKFENHCSQLLETQGRLGSEFQLLQALSVDISDTNTCTAAQLPDNKKKNRYTNILPYDATRVTLDIINDDPSSDYINASFVKGFSNTYEYIASQGPKEETISDFWRMVQQHDVQVIVMVTNWEENGKPKCDHYLPKLRDQIYFGDLVVRCGTELVFPVYTQRTIVLHKGTMKRNIAHLHFNEWPDFGCPETTESMLQFCRTLRHQVSLYPPGMVLVHCSAGVGRTGTLIAVDILLQQIQESKKVDVFGTVFKLRKHRTNMVQTKGQYEYIYKCIRDAVKDPTFLKSDGSPTTSLEPIYENVPTTLTTFLYEKVPHKVAKSNSSESECEL